MAKWTAFPYAADAYTYDSAALKKKWARLHAGDAEPLPKDESVLAAWALFHAGQFQKATEAGLKAHAAGAGAGMTVANKAQSIYATYLENSEKTKLALLYEVAERAEARTKEDPKDANAWYCMAYALGRYSQGISIAKALSQGLGAKVKNALETTIKLSPKHADAHTRSAPSTPRSSTRWARSSAAPRARARTRAWPTTRPRSSSTRARRSRWSSTPTGW
jgi:hypothetical protein